MDKKNFLEILGKYNRGEANQQETEMLEAYYGLFDSEGDRLDSISPAEKEKIRQEILLDITQQIASPAKNKRFLSFNKWWSIAAILLVITSIGVLFYKKSDTNTPTPETAPTLAVVKPGSNQAILTLEDGSTIGLNDKQDGLILDRNGVKVEKLDNGKVAFEANAQAAPALHTIATPRGGQYQIVLDDGTKVWLNAASSLKFPTRFTGTQRMVEITGEVYFEVAKNKRMPFIVKTKRQQIEVLGTQFNVNSYGDEDQEVTTLLEGAVKVAVLKNGLAQSSTERMLSPGNQASLPNDVDLLSLTEADLEAALAWKNGYFKFEKADIKTIMRQISRWYDVDVQYVGGLSGDAFGGKIPRTEEITGVLRLLELSKIKATLKGRIITIKN